MTEINGKFRATTHQKHQNATQDIDSRSKPRRRKKPVRKVSILYRILRSPPVVPPYSDAMLIPSQMLVRELLYSRVDHVMVESKNLWSLVLFAPFSAKGGFGDDGGLLPEHLLMLLLCIIRDRRNARRYFLHIVARCGIAETERIRLIT